MINLSADTCIWLELLKVDFNNEDNYLEELCYWIENKHLKHIVPTNIIDEWNRHKLNYQKEITNYFKKNEVNNINPFKNNRELSSTYQPETIEINVQKRIERIDLILNTHSEKAPFDNSILKDAADRNLKTLAPNHQKDSFRDTVNILSLIHYLKKMGYNNSIFTTLNYKDFSADSGKKYDLHSDLVSNFITVDLKYIYFGETESFGTKLFNQLRTELSEHSFQDYLKNKKEKEESKELENKKSIAYTTIEKPDLDYLENIKYIDMILVKKEPTQAELDILKLLTGRHDSYKQYLLKNIGNNGMV